MGFYDMSKYKKVNVKVEYDRIPIRHMAVQCPDCKNWFASYDIVQSDWDYEHQINGAICECPICQNSFGISDDSNIEESGEFPEFYDKCKKQVTTWK